ncbi:CopK family periplasmic copper-binding protein [Cupriavidus ulmosensis]
METKDGEKLMMKGNEVWRMDSVLPSRTNPGRNSTTSVLDPMKRGQAILAGLTEFDAGRGQMGVSQLRWASEGCRPSSAAAHRCEPQGAGNARRRKHGAKA